MSGWIQAAMQQNTIVNSYKVENVNVGGKGVKKTQNLVNVRS